ncbi:hypothetical protein [Microbacterium elymi]|uniref:NYN domain-containing protein n=1 Tax=Microbacterium elymi TaxID=2909587 RepID=A0ABY5NNK6_9MICO|nr:hypothetical protein [Microbacterium elymi]UUT36750.1 hypothetical protein L2X98_33325 [Microbacterium elymi]
MHPGFADSWARLRGLLDVHPAIVVDAANVVGSVPDGWWRDRAGAAGRLIADVAGLVRGGVDADALGLAEHRWFPEASVVIEGQAKAAADQADVRVVRAEASGDDAIVAEAQRRVDAGATVTVVTSDRELARPLHGAGCRGARPEVAARSACPRDSSLSEERSDETKGRCKRNSPATVRDSSQGNHAAPREGAHSCPRKRSISRRSRLVGRPAPRSR